MHFGSSSIRRFLKVPEPRFFFDRNRLSFRNKQKETDSKYCSRRLNGFLDHSQRANYYSTSTPAAILEDNGNLIKFKVGKLVEWDYLKDEKVAIIRLNDPKRLNALTVEMGEEFQSVIEQISDICNNSIDIHSSEEISRRRNETEIPSKYSQVENGEGINIMQMDIRSVILTGAGKAFSAGGDLNWLLARHKDSPSNNSKIMREFYRRYLTIRDLPVPVISAINGPAVGAGFCVALATDIRIACTQAKMGVTFVNLGLHPGMGATFFLPNVVDKQTANLLLYTGDLISGIEAERMGVVADAIPPEEGVLDRCISIGKKIGTKSPLATRLLVTSLRNQMDSGTTNLESSLRREADAQGLGYNSNELKEGVNAVAEKRKPIF